VKIKLEKKISLSKFISDLTKEASFDRAYIKGGILIIEGINKSDEAIAKSILENSPEPEPEAPIIKHVPKWDSLSDTQKLEQVGKYLKQIKWVE
jgi:hypothetical protein